MQAPEERIHKFIGKHHVFTLATTVAGQPWCTSCFYAYWQNRVSLVFTSEQHTRHVNEFTKNKQVAGTIHLETKIVGMIRGIQFIGEVVRPDEAETARLIYLKRFPFAVFMDSEFWVLRIDSIKMTDNRLGFGKKIHWTRDEN